MKNPRISFGLLGALLTSMMEASATSFKSDDVKQPNLVYIQKVQVDGYTRSLYRSKQHLSRSIYQPHQSKKECARRVRQLHI